MSRDATLLRLLALHCRYCGANLRLTRMPNVRVCPRCQRRAALVQVATVLAHPCGCVAETVIPAGAQRASAG